MKKIIKEGQKLEKFTLTREAAIRLMEERDEPYKVELIQELPENEEISFYRQGGDFTDLCAGPHLISYKTDSGVQSLSPPRWLTGEVIRARRSFREFMELLLHPKRS